MSSPAGRRSTRSSQAGTPSSRNTRNSQARSSPAAGGTPRGLRAPSSQLQSSPLLYESSPAAEANMGGASSPLRQMSDTQSTQDALLDPDHPMRGMAPSSPLAHMTETQSVSAGDRTPRASRGLLGGEQTRSWS